MLGHILASLCKYCFVVQHEAKKRATELERPCGPNAEEAEKTPAIRTKEARLKAEEQGASVKSVKEAEDAAEAARKAEEDKAEKPAVIRAEEARLKAEAGEWTAAEKPCVVTREAQSSVTKAKEAPMVNKVASRQAVKDEETAFQAAKTKEEAARHAREAKAAKPKEQAASADRRKAKRA